MSDKNTSDYHRKAQLVIQRIVNLIRARDEAGDAVVDAVNARVIAGRVRDEANDAYKIADLRCFELNRVYREADDALERESKATIDRRDALVKSW